MPIPTVAQSRKRKLPKQILHIEITWSQNTVPDYSGKPPVISFETINNKKSLTAIAQDLRSGTKHNGSNDDGCIRLVRFRIFYKDGPTKAFYRSGNYLIDHDGKRAYRMSKISLEAVGHDLYNDGPKH